MAKAAAAVYLRITTVDDYITFADAIACGGVGKTKNRILSENSIKLMGENQLNETCLEDFHKIQARHGNWMGIGYVSYL